MGIATLLFLSMLVPVAAAFVCWRIPAEGAEQDAWHGVAISLLLVSVLAFLRVLATVSPVAVTQTASIVESLLLCVICLMALVCALRVRTVFLQAREAKERAEDEGVLSREAEALWQRVFEFAPDGYLLLHLDGRVERANRAAAKIAGLDKEAIEGRPALELGLLSAEQKASAAEALEATPTESGVFHFDYTIQRPDGDSCQVELVSHTLELAGRTMILCIAHDISEREGQANELSLNRQRLAEAQKVAGLMTWGLDFQTDRLWMSQPPVDAPTPHASAETEGGDDTFAIDAMVEYVHPDDRERVQASIAACLKENGPVDVVSEYRARGAAGDYRDYRTMAHTELNEEGSTLRLIGATLDITDMRQAEREILELNAQLETRVRDRTRELERAVSELEAFSYSVSHDLRSPLRAMAGYSDMVAEELGSALTESSREHLQRIRSSSVRMAGMIDDLLSLARLTRAARSDEHVDLSELAGGILAELEQSDPHRVVETEVQAGVSCVGDPGMLGIALRNLLGNSWKFTRQQAEPRIEFGRDEDGRYFVQDNGVGFDESQATKLFQPFERLHRTDEFEGTGIGLATVARIVRRHGGTIDAHGAVGKGARIGFTLQPPVSDTGSQVSDSAV